MPGAALEYLRDTMATFHASAESEAHLHAGTYCLTCSHAAQACQVKYADDCRSMLRHHKIALGMETA